jgi:hypothetical protein
MRSVITESANRFSKNRAMTSSVNFTRAAARWQRPGYGRSRYPSDTWLRKTEPWASAL